MAINDPEFGDFCEVAAGILGVARVLIERLSSQASSSPADAAHVLYATLPHNTQRVVALA
jgi:hypothetical protein